MWLKIGFDPLLPGTSLVTKFPKRGHRRERGRWVVFDKDNGFGPLREYWNGARLFDAETIDECHAYIRQHKAEPSHPSATDKE
jgi:hypothetical protein